MIDFHTHSTYSDGTFTPSQIVEKAHEMGLVAVAVTDHETTAGVAEAVAKGMELDIPVIPGVEISSEYEGHSVHIVGLFIDTENPELQAVCGQIAEARAGRNTRIVEQLQNAGINISPEDLARMGSERMVTRANIASLLVERGYAADNKDAFDRYLKRGTPGYVKRYKPDIETTLNAIHAAGGLAFVAHINQIDASNLINGASICKAVIEMGADGLEAQYSEYDEGVRCLARFVVKETGCLKSGGSDFHGAIKPGLMLGTGYGDLDTPDSYYIDMVTSRMSWE